jgi:5-methylcytosine-specific restriction endonuclease McrA
MAIRKRQRPPEFDTIYGLPPETLLEQLREQFIPLTQAMEVNERHRKEYADLIAPLCSRQQAITNTIDQIYRLAELENSKLSAFRRIWDSYPKPDTMKKIYALTSEKARISHSFPKFSSERQVRTKDIIGQDRWSKYGQYIFREDGAVVDLTVRRLVREIQRIERILVKKKKHEALDAKEEAIDAMAAAHQGKTRKRADKVKRAIRHQVKHYPHCPYCGGPLGDNACADHIYPVSIGGLSTPENMVYICFSCNSQKSNMTLRSFVKLKALDWALIESALERLGKCF